MTTYSTGNPLGSSDPRDFYDNAENLDNFVNGDQPEYEDRLGQSRKSWQGIEDEFAAFIAASGYEFVGDYAAGIELTGYQQILRDTSGEFWRLSGSVTLPYTTTGAGLPEGGNFVAVGDAALRQELADPDQGAAMVAYVGPGGTAYSLADLANPDMGAAMVARGVVAVDSIADLLALPEGQRQEGLRYLVKGYHAGSDVGGGEFYWDASRAGENNHGTVIDGWVRVPSSFIDMHCFGGDSYVGDPFEAIQAAIDSTLPHGTVSTEGWTGQKEFDGRIQIEKPLTMLGGDGKVRFRLADQSDIFHLGGSRSLVHIRSSDVVFSGFHIDCNNVNNFVTSDGVNYYVNETEEVPSLGTYYLRCVSVESYPDIPISNVTIENNRLENCATHAVGVNGPKSLEYFEAEGAPRVEDYHLYCRNIKVSGNYISKFGRSGIYFFGGVVQSIIENNTAEDGGWIAYRAYLGTADIVIQNNRVILDKDVDLTTIANSKDEIPERLGWGAGVGHRNRAPGTSRDILIMQNRFYSNGSRRYSPTSVRVFEGNDFISVIDNTVDSYGGLTTLPSNDGYNGDFFINSSRGLRVEGNSINTLHGVAINLENYETNPAGPAQTIVSRNTLTFKGDYTDPEVMGSGILVRNWLLGAAVTLNSDFTIESNTLIGFRCANIYVTANNSGEYAIRNNAIYEADAVVPSTGSTLLAACIYAEIDTVYLIEGNLVKLKDSAVSGVNGIRFSSMASGIASGNVLIGGAYFTDESNAIRENSGKVIVAGNTIIDSLSTIE